MENTSDVRLNRRTLLGVTGLAGATALLGQTAPQAGRTPRLTVPEVLTKARERLAPTCRVCPVCDGVACAGESSGIGGIGTGMSFQNNFTALQHIRLNLRTVTDVTKVDPSTTVFGRKISFPAFAAPMGPAATRLGKGMPVPEWFDSIIGGSVAAGTLGAVGDSPTYTMDEMQSRWDIIARYKGQALYDIKPVPNPTILKLIPYIEASGAACLSIDTDSAGRYGSEPPDRRVGPKSVAQLRELVRALKIPLVVKGVMTPDEAVKALDAGVAAIAVSNHGGRVLDYTPGTAEVLPAIAAKVKGKMTILVDGCAHTGADVLKYVALGADAVLVGRHILRAAYGGGVEGVALFMNNMRDEFERAMVLTGVSRVDQIGRAALA